MATFQSAIRYGICMALSIYVIFCLFRTPIAILFLDRAPYALTDDELVTADALQTPELIPKIIHQVYNIWSDGAIPSDWESNRKSCMDRHLDFNFPLWNFTSSLQFLRDFYPSFVPIWESYPESIQRADSIRYFLLAHYGGIYLDMDVACTGQLEPLLHYAVFLPGAPSIGLSNDFMGSVPGHVFFLTMIEKLQAYKQNWIVPYLTIMNTAGSHYISFIWVKYISDWGGLLEGANGRVRILLQEQRSMVKRGRGKSWHRWDNELFAVLDKDPYFSGIIICFGVFIGWGAAWYAVGKANIWWKGRMKYGRYRVPSVGGKMLRQE